MRRRQIFGVVLVGALAGLVSLAPPAMAAPTLSVSPGAGVSSGATVSVHGRGYSPTANNGVGIYVAWCKLVPQYWTSADNCGDARWVHSGAGLNADGSFGVTLTLAGSVSGANCTVAGACKVVTMAAHGSSDRSQDAVVGVAFRAATTPPKSTPTPTAKSTVTPTVRPSASGGPTSPGSAATSTNDRSTSSRPTVTSPTSTTSTTVVGGTARPPVGTGDSPTGTRAAASTSLSATASAAAGRSSLNADLVSDRAGDDHGAGGGPGAIGWSAIVLAVIAFAATTGLVLRRRLTRRRS